MLDPTFGRYVLYGRTRKALPEVVAACDHVCGAEGGHGAVREVAELLLKAQGRWVAATGRWLVAAPRSAAE